MHSKKNLSVLLALLVCGTVEQGPGVMGAEVNVVVGPGLMYYPRMLEINLGDTVVWKWAYSSFPGTFPHTVTQSISFDRRCEKVADDEKLMRGIDFHSGVKLSGYEFRHTFTKVEHVIYHCETTPVNCDMGMWGEIFVVPQGAITKDADLSEHSMQPGLFTSITMDNKPVQNLITGVADRLFGSRSFFRK